jgi:hypothetical protein
VVANFAEELECSCVAVLGKIVDGVVAVLAIEDAPGDYLTHESYDLRCVEVIGDVFDAVADHPVVFLPIANEQRMDLATPRKFV